MKRYCVSIFVVSFIVSCSAMAQLSREAGLNKTNVILIITDDQGYGDMSCHGNSLLKTPNIDALYDESTRLTDFHVSPTCAPTRAALMTGHYANRTGVWHTIGGRSLLRESETTMAEIFAENGYATGIFGKWHLGDNYPFRPQDRGFQETLILGGGGIGQGPDYWNNDYFDDTYLHNGQPKKFTGYCTDVWFENAIDFIDKHSESEIPFFCYLATNAPHDPFYVGNNYVAPFKDNGEIASPEFYGMISNLDENLGKLLNYLKRNNLEENTLLLFMTDNGTSGGVTLSDKDTRVEKGYNAGMRGKKGSMYEGGHRVPLFMRWPGGGVKANRNINDLTAHIDVLPTLVDLLDLKMPANVVFDGISLKNKLLNKYTELPERAVITDSQRKELPEKWRQSSVMQGKWRLINGTELYNIQTDPGQKDDLANLHPKILAQLRKEYETWWKGISPVFNESPAIMIGSSFEPTTLLRSHDMHMDKGYDLVPWNHEQIRQGMQSNGWYVLNAVESGTYQIRLLRWPPEARAGDFEGLPGRPPLTGTTVEPFSTGEALKIKEAGISIDGKKYQLTELNPVENDGITFEVPVEKGTREFRAWFINEKSERFTPYYVEVKKK